MAARAGVAPATVSRVLAGQTAVNAEMRRRVLKAAEELGYQPDILAQGLRSGASRSVGFIADDLSHNTIADIATGAEGVLRAENYSLLVMNSEREARLDAVNVRVLMARRVDALMLAPVTEDDPDLIAQLTALDIPLVVIEGELPEAVPACLVASDHRAGVRSALLHLMEVGHTRISVLTGPYRFRSARQRRVAVDDVPVGVSAGAQITAVTAELTTEAARQATGELLSGAEVPTAIVVGASELLVGVLEAVRAAGLVIGSDVSLVTSDPLPLASVFDPPLAAITRDSLGLGVKAAELLLERLRTPGLPAEQAILPTYYRPRGSVGPPRARSAVSA